MHPSSTWMAQQHTIRALGSQQSSQGIERQTPPGRSSEGITVARLAAIQQGSSLADEFHGWGISCMIAILRKRRLCVLFFSERAITYIFGQTYIPASSFSMVPHTPAAGQPALMPAAWRLRMSDLHGLCEREMGSRAVTPQPFSDRRSVLLSRCAVKACRAVAGEPTPGTSFKGGKPGRRTEEKRCALVIHDYNHGWGDRMEGTLISFSSLVFCSCS
jgi:hypothetical protein